MNVVLSSYVAAKESMRCSVPIVANTTVLPMLYVSNADIMLLQGVELLGRTGSY